MKWISKLNSLCFGKINFFSSQKNSFFGNCSILGMILAVVFTFFFAKNSFEPFLQMWGISAEIGCICYAIIVIAFMFLLLLAFSLLGKCADISRFELKDFGRLFINIFTFLFISIVFIPTESYFANMNDFDLRFKCIAVVYIPLALILSALISGFTANCKPQVKNVISDMFCGVSIAMYIQYMFANQLTKMIDGSHTEWGLFKKEIILNLIWWIAVVSIPFLIRKFFPDIWKKVIVLLSSMLLGVHLITFSVIAVTGIMEENRISFAYFSNEEQFCVSPNDNIVVFVIDALDNDYLKTIYEEESDLFDRFSDFTMYTNTCSEFDSTIPSILTTFAGGEYHNDISAAEWYHETWEKPKTRGFYSRIHEAGYQTHFYNFYVGNPVECIGYVDNVVPIEEVHISDVDYLKYNMNMLKLSSYRLMPYIAKSFLNIETLTFEELINIENYKTTDYANEDFDRNCNLRISESSDSLMSCQMIRGTHLPCDDIMGTTHYCLDIVEKYLNQLKKLGKYDDALIIVMSDHGKQDTDSPVPIGATPVFMIKEPGITHDRIALNSSPIWHPDLIPTILENIDCYDESNLEDVATFGTSIYMHQEGEPRERAWYNRWHCDGIETHYSKYAYSSQMNSFYVYKYIGDTEELKHKVEMGEVDEIIPIYDFIG